MSHSHAPSERTRLDRVLLVVAGADAVALAATGAVLVLRYRPSLVAGDPIGASDATFSDWLRLVHRVSAGVLLGLLAVWTVVLVGRAVSGGVRSSTVAVGAAGFAIAATGWLTGRWLPWDQLALWSVTVGDDLSGYSLLWDDRVRFVVVGGEQVSVEQLRVALILHAALIPALLVSVGWLALHRRRAGAPTDR